jgi:PAS domain S-box-containing protein
MEDIVARPWGNDTVLAPGYKVPLFYLSVFQGLAIFKLVQRYREAKRGTEQLQLKYLFFAFGLSFPIGILVAGFLPLIAHSGRYFYLGNLSSILTASIISYAIIRHRLLEIEMVIGKTLYLTAASLGIFTLLLTLDFLLHTILHLPKILSILFSAIILTILMGTLKRRLDSWIKGIFFKEVFTYQIALREFSRQLTTILDLPQLQRFIVEKIGQIMKIDRVSLLLLDEKRKEYRIVATYPPDKNSFEVNGIQSSSPASKQLREKQQILILDELSKSFTKEEAMALEKDFSRLGSKLLIPLLSRGELIGILSLGSKLKGGIYSDEDVNLFQSIGNEAALALENAQLYHEVLVMRDNYEMILQHMDNGVIAADLEEVVVTFNNKAGEILHMEPKEILGQKIDRLGKQIASIFQQTLQGQRHYNKLLRLSLPTRKEKRILSVSSSLIKGQDGRILGGLLVFSDVTELKRLQEEVKRGEKLATLGSMAARVAHEIRNPLVSVKTFCQMLPDKYQDQGFREVFLPLVIKEVDRISNITEDLLNFSRVSPRVLKLVAVQEVLEESLALIKQELRKKEIIVNKDYTQENISLLTDPDKLKQVFLNLFTNSIQAMDKGGILTIKTEIESNGEHQESPILAYDSVSSRSPWANARIACIRISDTGKGIPEENISDIFEPFFTTKEKGTGLGLVISQEIVKELKGSIEVESQLGEGSTFIIRLPLSTKYFGEAYMSLQSTKVS